LARIGILGGTFNPPHLGHLALARHARSELGLSRVVMIPASRSPEKQGEEDPGAERRLEMCRLLSREQPLEVCALEVERGGTSYTVDTLRAISSRNPHDELTFIVGADVAATLPSWREPRELLELADLAVAARPGTDRSRVFEALERIDGASGVEPRFLEMPPIDVSSSIVRERAAAGEPIEELVGADLARYIAGHGLYRDGCGASR
jgi:nicotinate-nucleotide adenylyltransferase